MAMVRRSCGFCTPARTGGGCSGLSRCHERNSESCFGPLSCWFMKLKLAASVFAILGIGCAMGFLGGLQAFESAGTQSLPIRAIGFGVAALLCGVGCLGCLVVAFSRGEDAK